MTNTERYKSLFPLKGIITQDIIDNANISSINNCIGSLTLKAALGDNIDLLDCSGGLWGNSYGSNHIKDGGFVRITTTDGVEMMGVNKPMEVTFIVID